MQNTAHRRNVIKAEAALAGVTLAEVAETVGVSRRTVYKVAAGELTPWPKLRHALADYFGVPESRLFPDTDDELV